MNNHMQRILSRRGVGVMDRAYLKCHRAVLVGSVLGIASVGVGVSAIVLGGVMSSIAVLGLGVASLGLSSFKKDEIKHQQRDMRQVRSMGRYRQRVNLSGYHFDYDSFEFACHLGHEYTWEDEAGKKRPGLINCLRIAEKHKALDEMLTHCGCEGLYRAVSGGHLSLVKNILFSAKSNAPNAYRQLLFGTGKRAYGVAISMGFDDIASCIKDAREEISKTAAPSRPKGIRARLTQALRLR